MDVLSWDVITESVFHTGVLRFDAVSHLSIPLFPLVRLLLFSTIDLLSISSSFWHTTYIDEGEGFPLLLHISLIFLRVEAFVATDVIEGDGDLFKHWDEPGGFMAIPMNTPCGKDESVDGINDEEDFEVVTFSDSSFNSFNVGEARCGLHHTSAVNHGTGPGFYDEG